MIPGVDPEEMGRSLARFVVWLAPVVVLGVGIVVWWWR